MNGHGYISRDQMVMALRMLNFNPIDSELEDLLSENDNTSNSLDIYITTVLSLDIYWHSIV